MNLKNKFALNFFIGFSISIVICLLIPVISSLFVEDPSTVNFCALDFIKIFNNEKLAFVINCILAGLIGGIIVATSIVYEFEKWSILKATVVHFIISLSSVFTVAYILKWWSFNDITLNLIIILAFILAYMFVWLIQFLKYKHDIKDIENEIKEIKSNNK